MNSKKIMSILAVALLFTKMGFADVGLEFNAEEVQPTQNQEVVVTEEEINYSALPKAEASEVAVEDQFDLDEVQN